jgi:hypothetical protein
LLLLWHSLSPFIHKADWLEACCKCWPENLWSHMPLLCLRLYACNQEAVTTFDKILEPSINILSLERITSNLSSLILCLTFISIVLDYETRNTQLYCICNDMLVLLKNDVSKTWLVWVASLVQSSFWLFLLRQRIRHEGLWKCLCILKSLENWFTHCECV